MVADLKRPAVGWLGGGLVALVLGLPVAIVIIDREIDARLVASRGADAEWPATLRELDAT